jgi:cytochrome bd-type quinol oxidase subunit 2
MVPAGLDLIHSSCETEAIAAKAWFVCMALYSWWTFFSDEGSLRNALLKQGMMWIVMLLSTFLAGALWNRRISEKCPEN